MRALRPIKYSADLVARADVYPAARDVFGFAGCFLHLAGVFEFRRRHAAHYVLVVPVRRTRISTAQSSAVQIGNIWSIPVNPDCTIVQVKAPVYHQQEGTRRRRSAA